VAFWLALIAALPALVLRATGIPVSVAVATSLCGIAIVAAAFALSWAAEAAERDVPRAVALTAVALLAVLPEYAVDIVFAWKAGADPAFAPYAAANMTGSNRLLLGLGWSSVVLLGWYANRKTVVFLDKSSASGLVFLGIATAYSFVLPLKGSVSLIDSVVLLGVFAACAVVAARAEVSEPELIGPAARIGALPGTKRRVAVLALMLFAAATIAAVAEPFAAGLVETGRLLRIDEFLLVQWLAPIASEAPEFLVAALLALRGKTVAALALLIAAKINQWTLLVGSLPVAYSWGGGRIAALPLDERQTAEVLLTAAQSLFGLGTLASLSLSLTEGALLAALFILQLVLGGVLRVGLHDPGAASAELSIFAALYVILGGVALIRARRPFAQAVRESLAAFWKGPRAD
jgi:cation:H+ antiporter